MHALHILGVFLVFCSPFQAFFFRIFPNELLLTSHRCSTWSYQCKLYMQDQPSPDKLRSKSIQKLADPLLNYSFVAQVIKAWSRPLPESYIRRPLVIVGPSGVGKGRLIRDLEEDYGKFVQKVVTHTTRRPRPSEVNGSSYHFVTRQEFEKLRSEDYFIETATVHNNFYGMSFNAWEVVRNKSKISIFEIDIQGAKSIKALESKLDINPVYVFVAPPNIEKLHERLLLRGSETTEEIALRLENAKIEIEEAKKTDIFKTILVNDDFRLTSNAMFRFVRDNYQALPSAAKLKMLQRRLRDIKQLAKEGKEAKLNQEATSDGNADIS